MNDLKQDRIRVFLKITRPAKRDELLIYIHRHRPRYKLLKHWVEAESCSHLNVLVFFFWLLLNGSFFKPLYYFALNVGFEFISFFHALLHRSIAWHHSSRLFLFFFLWVLQNCLVLSLPGPRPLKSSDLWGHFSSGWVPKLKERRVGGWRVVLRRWCCRRTRRGGTRMRKGGRVRGFWWRLT